MLAKRHYALHTYLKLIYRRLSLLPDSDVEESERLFRLYMEEDPLDENIYRLMMERYRACGLYYKGLKLYDRMVHLFEKELSASPGKELQKLHHRMLDALNAERPAGSGRRASGTRKRAAFSVGRISAFHGRRIHLHPAFRY